MRETFDVRFEKRTDEQKQTVLTAFVEQAAENKTTRRPSKKLRAAKPTIVTTMVMRELAKPRRTYLFIKGDFTRDGGTVGAGRAGGSAPAGEKRTTNRLDLAKWLVDPQNPLTARVTVNRLWQQYFGRGIVETENDFGTQGSPPSHPELLDWLATEFMAQGWSLKAMHRLIVTSATYRQSSRVRPELSVIDPNNKLLARQNRFRLDAEVVRDAALSASGLLNPEIGGPSVFPPIPDGVMSLGQVKREWKVSAGGDRFRRGLYTFYFRATPPPAWRSSTRRTVSALAPAASLQHAAASAHPAERPAVLRAGPGPGRAAPSGRTESDAARLDLGFPPLPRPFAQTGRSNDAREAVGSTSG